MAEPTKPLEIPSKCLEIRVGGGGGAGVGGGKKLGTVG